MCTQIKTKWNWRKTDMPPKPAETALHVPNHKLKNIGEESGAMMQRSNPQKKYLPMHPSRYMRKNSA